MNWDKESGTWERHRFHQDLGIGGYAQGSVEHQGPGNRWAWCVEVYYITGLDVGMGIKHRLLKRISGVAKSFREAEDAIPVAIQLILIKAHITGRDMGNLDLTADRLMQALRRQSLE